MYDIACLLQKHLQVSVCILDAVKQELIINIT